MIRIIRLILLWVSVVSSVVFNTIGFVLASVFSGNSQSWYFLLDTIRKNNEFFREYYDIYSYTENNKWFSRIGVAIQLAFNVISLAIPLVISIVFHIISYPFKKLNDVIKRRKNKNIVEQVQAGISGEIKD